MRKLCGVLTALVVSGSLVSVSIADEKADVAMVEREIRAVDESIAIHKRAKKRAEKAVSLSSVGREYQKAKDEAAKAWATFKASPAYRRYLGDDKIENARDFALSIGENVVAQYERWLLNKYHAEQERRRKAYEKGSKLPKILSDKAALHAEQVSLFVKKMTRIFLSDEIEKAEQKKLDGLTRELKKIRKKDYAHI